MYKRDVETPNKGDLTKNSSAAALQQCHTKETVI